MSISKNKDYCCVIDNLLYYGDKKLASKDDELIKLGIKAIVCLLPKKKQIYHNEEFFSVLNINTEDFVTCSINEWADKASDFIDNNICNNKPVYVHCLHGISRSTACILHYLISKKNMNLKDSFIFVLSKRSVAAPTIGFFKDLINFEKKKFGKNSITLREYSLLMIKENFPTLDANEIENVYDKYEKLYTIGLKKDEYNDEMEKQKHEPIGFHTIEELINGKGKGKYKGRRGGGIHHPFD